MFTWLMIFVTHLFFRRHYRGTELSFRMWGFPVTSIAGAILMTGLLVTTWFTTEFRMTLAYGLPFLAILTLVYRACYRNAGDQISHRKPVGIATGESV